MFKAHVYFIFLFVFVHYEFSAGVEFRIFNELQTIRIFIENAPGYGHQAAALSVVKRLNELGYQGRFEVIYPIEIQEKVLQLFQDNPRTRRRMSFQTLDEYLNEFALGKIQTVEYSISAGDDELVKYVLPYSKSKYYIQLQPFGWGESYIYSSDLSVQLKDHLMLSLANLNLKQDKQFIKDVDKNMQINSQVKLLIRYLNNSGVVEHPQFEYFPIYGVGFIQSAAAQIRFYLKAVHHRMKLEKNTSPIIVPIISRFQDLEMLDFDRQFGKRFGFESLIPEERKFDRMVQIVDLTRGDQLPAFEKGKIYLVFTGFVPQFVFDHLVVNSTMPVWLAGKNAMNLALRFGKAYLNTVGDYYFPDSETQEPALRQQLQKVSHFHLEMAKINHHPLLQKDLSQFIGDARRSESPFSVYLNRLSLDLKKIDKVENAIHMVENMRAGRLCEQVFNID